MSELSQRMLAWAVAMFGSYAQHRDERAARLLEEALELAQAEGLAREIAHRLVDRTYGRPVGTTRQEVGQVAITLRLLATNLKLDADREMMREWRRVREFSREHWDQKHGAKIRDQVANLTPGGER